MSSARILCACCRRLVPARKDGRVQAHLAVLGRRGKCAGSGMPSARMETSATTGQAIVPADPWSEMTEAEKFNAADAWALADALYADYVTMTDAGCASPRAEHEQYEAYSRAWHTAKALAPLGFTWAMEEASGAA